MPLLLLVLFVVVPAAEIYVLIQVGQLIGALPTVLLLLADAVLGAWLTKREGRRAWRSLQEALRDGRMPATEVADGALVVVGGAFLLTPGFLTDVLGVLCLLPPSRAVLRRVLARVVARRLLPPVRRDGLSRYGRPRRTAGRVVEGEFVDEDPGR